MKLLLDNTGREHGLNANEACVYAAIVKCTKSGKGWFSNYRELANALPFVINRMTVSRAIQKLQTLGLIMEDENGTLFDAQNVHTDAQNVHADAQNVHKSTPPYNPPINKEIIKEKNNYFISSPACAGNDEKNLIDLKEKIYMETLENVINRKESLRHIMALIDPQNTHKEQWNICANIWNRKDLAEQRRIYYYLRQKIRAGEKLYGTPYDIIKGCQPYPTNYNGKPGINTMMKTARMVKARYKGSYGIYTAGEAILFEMDCIEPLNFKPNDQA